MRSRQRGRDEGKSSEGLLSAYLMGLSSVQLLSHVRLFGTPWTAAYQASLSINGSSHSSVKHIVGMLNGKIYYLDLPIFSKNFYSRLIVSSFYIVIQWSFTYMDGDTCIHTGTTLTHTHTHRVPEIEGNQSIHILNLRILYNSIKYLKNVLLKLIYKVLISTV